MLERRAYCHGGDPRRRESLRIGRADGNGGGSNPRANRWRESDREPGAELERAAGRGE